MMHVPQFDEWPKWLQEIVWVPNAALVVILMIWWPKNPRGWRRFGFILAWLVAFLLVMLFIFGMRNY